MEYVVAVIKPRLVQVYLVHEAFGEEELEEILTSVRDSKELVKSSTFWSINQIKDLSPKITPPLWKWCHQRNSGPSVLPLQGLCVISSSAKVIPLRYNIMKKSNSPSLTLWRSFEGGGVVWGAVADKFHNWCFWNQPILLSPSAAEMQVSNLSSSDWQIFANSQKLGREGKVSTHLQNFHHHLESRITFEILQQTKS